MLERFRRTPPTLRERIRLRESSKRRRNPLLARLGDADQALLRLMRTRLHGPGPDAVMRGLGFAGEWAAVWVLAGAGAAALDAPRRNRWLAAAAVGPAAVCANFAVKVAVGRERPLIEGHPPLARAPSKLSFPSAHATSSVAAATALGRVEPAAKPGLYTLAAAICLSRPYLGMHYPSDVIAGVVLGRMIGRVAPGVGNAAAGAGDPLSAATPTTV
jgi:undecaprenyl-diphosphatase